MLEKVGKYKIVAKIGQGAMGEVYKAHDTALNRFVAIKTIAGSLGSDDQFRKRFHREAQSAAQLNHRNIVTVFEFAEDRGMVYMVMELLEGTDLKDLIARRSLKRFEEKLSIIEQICEGLAYAHSKGVVHRDLKPANIHVLSNGTVKIMDFGLARLGVSEITRTGTVMGTPNYMSPEQVRGEKVDARSDIFSVGALMYEVLAGQKPFEAESMHSVLFQVLDQNPVPIQSRTPDVPIPIAQVVDKALAKEPAQRFQAAGEMRTALRNARRVMAAGQAAAAALSTPDDVSLEEDPTLARPAATFISTGPDDFPTSGATALETSPVSGAASDPTRRPPPTVVRPKAPATSAKPFLIAGAGLLVLAGVGTAVFLRSRTAQVPAASSAEAAKAQEKILRETLIAGHVELAQDHLANKSYAEAVAEADWVLGLEPGNPAAQDIKRRAQVTLGELEATAKEARTAFAGGDTALASQKLARVLALDPRHPVVGELSAALDQHFRGQAEEAKTAAQQARAEAERRRARSQEAFAAADRGVAEAERLLRGGQFAQATQKFLEAGDGFARARRAAEAAEAAAAKAAAVPSAPPTTPRAADHRPPGGVPPHRPSQRERSSPSLLGHG
jgi:serine/threonine protein kinase